MDTTVVAASKSVTIRLPWVATLKSFEFNHCGKVVAPVNPALQPNGAYHVTSSRPVSVTQVSPLQRTNDDGPADKDWTLCAGLAPCSTTGTPLGCTALAREGTLLLPVSAMTGNYRVTGWDDPTPSFFTVTATANDTHVELTPFRPIQLPDGQLATPDAPRSLTLQAGDVALIVGREGGVHMTRIAATHPVQVLAGKQCAEQPYASPLCNHMEDTVVPTEALGRRYVVPVTSGPSGAPRPHFIGIFAFVNDTRLDTPEAVLDTSRLNAGDATWFLTDKNISITSNQPLAVVAYTTGNNGVPGGPTTETLGGPAMTAIAPVDQFRKRYAFAAASDRAYADITAPKGTAITLDGAPITVPFEEIGTTGFGVFRQPLSRDNTHVLVASHPVGVQIVEYAKGTAIFHPAGIGVAPLNPTLK